MRPLTAAVYLLLSTLASSAWAALVPVHVSAQISSIDPSLFYGFSLLGVGIGTTVNVTLVVDTSTPDTYSTDPTRGLYANAVRSVSVSAGTWSATTVRGSCCESTISVLNQNQPPPNADNWQVGVPTMSAPDSPAVLGTITTLSVSLFDPSGAIVVNDAILPPIRAPWPDGIVDFQDPNQAQVVARLLSASVPEPSTSSLAAAAAMAMLGYRQRVSNTCQRRSRTRCPRLKAGSLSS
jgi:hypothetical protein